MSKEEARKAAKEFRERLRSAMEVRSWSSTLVVKDFVMLLDFVSVELAEWLVALRRWADLADALGEATVGVAG